MRDDELIKDDSILGGQESGTEVMIPVSEVPGYWRKFMAWLKRWKETH